MAKTTSGVGVPNVSTGATMSTFTMSSARRRQTAVIGDADDAGESLLVELPAHDSADRGSPLKVGGRASAAVFSDVASSDRTDAWFTLGGQMGVVATPEANVVYDGGRRTVSSVTGAGTLNSTPTSVTLVAATASVKTKVLGIQVHCGAFNALGKIVLKSGAAGTAIMNVGYFTTAIATATPNPLTIGFSGMVLCETAVNTLLEITYDGAGANTFAWHVIYYQAP